VNKKNINDIAASARTKLTTHAKISGRPFQEILQYTEVVLKPVGLQSEFTIGDFRQKQWSGFCLKSRIVSAPESLEEMVADIDLFLTPIAESIVKNQPLVQSLKPSGP